MRQAAPFVILVLTAGCLEGKATTLDVPEPPSADHLQLDIRGSGTGLFELWLKPGTYDVEISGDFDRPSDDPVFASQSFLYAYVYRAGELPRATGTLWYETFAIPVYDWSLRNETLPALNVSSDDRVMILVFSSLTAASIRLERIGSTETEPTGFAFALSMEASPPRLVLGEEQIQSAFEQNGVVAQRRITTEASGTSDPRSIVAGINWFYSAPSPASLRQIAYEYDYANEAGGDGHSFSYQDTGNARLLYSGKATVAFLSSAAETRGTTWVNETFAVAGAPIYIAALQMFLPVPSIAERIEWTSAIATSDERQSRRF